ncbi:uncharacterized protein RSE6_15141 [Rhynchosporium secalis]|uniref:Uncharacterized protein n=1 Tax=Rhynchosporium secalis TaxID=38038 RepID=A0A1E1MWS0_RHYSE|nr:uncharacterized protein RSE6_15141 [Rhynchosporium secalis]
MSASQQYASQTGADARHLASNINPDSPTSPPSNGGHSASRNTGHEDAALGVPFRTTAKRVSMQDVDHEIEETLQTNAIESYFGKDGSPRADHQSNSREAGATQRAGSHGITNLSETFDERQNSVHGRTNLKILIRDAKISSETPSLLLPKAQLQAMATSDTQAPHIEAAIDVERLGSLGLKKRRREQTSDLPPVDNTASSDDGGRDSRRSKVDCDCDDVHTWWMTLKIGEMNEAVDRIDTAIGLAMNLSYGSNNMDNITIEYNLIDLLKELREILESAKDDMRAEGGRDREATG